MDLQSKERRDMTDISDTTVEPVDPQRWVIIRFEKTAVVLREEVHRARRGMLR